MNRNKIAGFVHKAITTGLIGLTAASLGYLGISVYQFFYFVKPQKRALKEAELKKHQEVEELKG